MEIFGKNLGIVIINMKNKIDHTTSGLVAIYKPAGPTSHDIVDMVRRATGVKKVGHAGTLDPLARGVLVVAIGREATKQISDVVAKEKEYIARVRLGVTSTTDDEEGEKEVRDIEKVSRSKVEKVVEKFVGEIEQVPPIYSAVKIAGQEAYKRARRGEEVKMKLRQVEIDRKSVV